MSSLLQLRSRLPDEIILRILHNLIGIPHVCTYVSGRSDFSLPRCPSPTRSIRKQLEDTGLVREYDRILTRMPKYFDEPRDIIDTHIAVFGTTQMRITSDYVIDHTRWFADIPDDLGHGLEKIHLDLYPGDYIALFKVTIPPFETTAWYDFSTRWPRSGPTDILQGTRELVLYFGDRYTRHNPWYDCYDSRWEDEDENGFSPMMRGYTCMQGQVIDWILSYAWQKGFIRHIRTVILDGPVQQWVRDKWEPLFKVHPKQRGRAYDIDLKAIETIGLDEVEHEEDWDPTWFYPPTCGDKCNPSCDELIGSKHIPWEGTEAVFASDEDMSRGPVGDWYDASEYSKLADDVWL
ncbi:hypothetical protein K491DRAFT_712213 [Lophiostoma macrostomum CBS 122681]|uniref:Uncharacterized protein n=1 Tax=Lophiostoma macrostomum CBS 122681 TaxID=1314788 RepID=A0A6A6TKF0_9PLEO|nr:hypothetical protein K491DRAFT_712213 [Lophiostoma macrostomum CBS 122681]